MSCLAAMPGEGGTSTADQREEGDWQAFERAGGAMAEGVGAEQIL